MSRAERPRRWRMRWRNLLTAVRGGGALQPWSVFTLCSAATISSSVSQIGLLDSWRTFRWGVATAVMAALATAAFLLLARAYWQRVRPLSVPATLAVFAVAGMGRLWLVGVLHTWASVPSLFSPWVRLWVGAFQGLLWVLVVSTFFANRDAFVAARADVLEEQAQLEARARATSALSSALARELADAVGRRVSASVARSRNLVRDSVDFQDSTDALRRVAHSLRTAIDDDIRPMSHQLWAEPPSEQMRLTMRSVLELGCYVRPYPVLMFSVIGFGSAAPMALSMPAPRAALVLLTLQLALMIIALKAAERWVRTPDRSPAAGFWTGIIASTLVTTAAPSSMSRLGWSAAEARYWMLTCGVSAVLLIVLLSVSAGLSGTQSSVLARARRSLSAVEVAQRVRARELAEASRVLARHLHSSLQGRLMAIALELERAADERNPRVAADAMRRLDTLMDTPLVAALETPVQDIEAALTGLVAEWSAIADVSLRYSLPAGIRVSRADRIVSIAEEAIANAVRHAHATQVSIEVSLADDVVVVRVSNNGSVSATRSAGLGSQLLDSVSPDNWSLRPLPDGAGMVLDVRLAIAPDEGSAV